MLKDDTQAFDCLVGYFYLSGFHKLCPALEKVSRIRILVGLSTDRGAYDLVRQAEEKTELALTSHAAALDQATGDLVREFEGAPDRAEVESGVHKFIDWIRSGKLEIKAFPSGNLHAKVYIMTFSEGDRDRGRVITGSSNLTQSGLRDNLEFNVELKNRSDYEFALAKFNELWASAVDLAKPYDEIVTNRSPYAHFTPYELYLKFLYEYFKAELNRAAELEGGYFPQGFKKLKYQEEAVLSAKRVLEEYGGVFLSDVVGLGKTYMAALLAQQLDGRCLVIAPPHLLDHGKRGSWPSVFGDFQVRQTDFVSSGGLDDLLRRDLSKYENVFIDESHRFRTETTQTYETLAQICRGKRVILVSATPLNNTPFDILSQIKLFQPGKASTIPNTANLEGFFGKLTGRLKGLDRQENREAYFGAVQQNAKAVRERVLKYLMIRRTRSEIATYYGADMESQGLKFPEVADPVASLYKFNANENEVFSETIRLLLKEFTYSRYKPLEYYRGPGLPEFEVQGQRNLARFMRVLIVKRLESSFTAFRMTLDRFIATYGRFIEEFQKGNVYISKQHIGKIFDLLEADDEEAVERLLDEGKADRLVAKDFTTDFLKDLQGDERILRRIQTLWSRVTRDPKWDEFRRQLSSDPRLKAGKLIVFTESRETAKYLADCVRTVEPRTLLFTGDSDEQAQRIVTANFDATAYQPADDFRILVSTEVLAEGVNLHRSNVVINYDIPWNPTRLIQRVGRVNRIDTKFDAIYTYNFFPTEEGNDLLKLREAAEAKIHAFIEMLGADSRLLTEDETVKSHDLFAKLNSKKTITGEDEDEESELEYLAEIRQVRDREPGLFERIKHLPKKARSTRLVPSESPQPVPSLLTYFRKGKLDKFYVVPPSETTPVELDFFDAARVLRPASKDELRQHLPQDFYALLDRNKASFDGATNPVHEAQAGGRSGSVNDAYILKRLRAKDVVGYHGFTDDDEGFLGRVRQLLQDGALPRPTTKRVAGALKHEIEPLKVLGILRRDISARFFEVSRGQAPNMAAPREVILSSYLLPKRR